MNLMLTRNNQKSSNIRWEPFATSTPLKVVPSNVEVEKNSQKQLKLSTDSKGLIIKLQKECSSTNNTEKKISDIKQLVTKLLIKNKSCANLEFSSSSDEDSASENSRPVIKLGLKNQTNSLLKSKKSEDQDVEIVKNKYTTDSNQIGTCKKKSTSGVKASKQNNNLIHNNKKSKQNSNVNLALDNLSLYEENQILDKLNPGNLADDTKLIFVKKEDNEQFFKTDENYKHFSNFKYKVNKSGSKQKTCTCIQKDCRGSKSLQDFETKGVRKRKCNKIEQARNSVKVSQNKKAKNKSLTPYKDEIKKTFEASFSMSEKKTNITHQLFSDKKEQELINTLNLTSEEVTETNESKGSFSQNKLTQSLLNLPHLYNHRNFIGKQNKHRVKKSNVKNLRSIKNIYNELLPVADLEKLEKNSKIFEENNKHIQESQKNTEGGDMPFESFFKNNSEKNDLNYRKTKRRKDKKVVRKIRKEKKTYAVKQAGNNSKNCENNAAGAGSSLGSENVFKNEKLSKPLQFAVKETIVKGKQVFKLINDLSYDEDITGCSAKECWNVNTFKCGVFKLRIKSEMNCRTLHSNSHLGGVVIKGNLRMKIGSNELDLQPGDMAFVPPLTDWQAKNIGECESVFYYWCGRFKT